MTKDFDAIVIGSGMGGLATASLLAKLRNYKVLVLERHFKVGGFTHTFTRHGHVFDVGVHYIGDMHEHGQTRKIFDLATDSGVHWQPMPYIFDKFVYPDFTVAVPSNETAYIEELCRLFPQERAALIRYFKDVKAVCSALEQKITAGLMPAPIAALINSLNFNYKNKALLSTAAYLNSNFQDPRLKAALVSQWGDYGLPPNLSSFAMHCMLVNHYLHGAYYPSGSASTIAASIVPIIERAGGKVLVNHKVEEILVEQGTARGVRTIDQHGKEITYLADTIISNAGIWPTYTSLLPKDYRLPVSGFSEETEGSAISLYLGLKASPEEVGIKGENLWLHTGYDHDSAYKHGLSMAGEPAFGFLSCASLRDPLATAHNAQLITIAGSRPFKKWANSQWMKRGSDYNEFKDKLANKLLNLAESRVPGFKDLVEYCEVSTPLTVESFTGHPAGRIYGQPLTTEVMAQRPLKADTHVRNLYLSGTDMLAPGVMGAFMGGVICAARIMGPTAMPEIISKAEKTIPKRFTDKEPILSNQQKAAQPI